MKTEIYDKSDVLSWVEKVTTLHLHLVDVLTPFKKKEYTQQAVMNPRWPTKASFMPLDMARHVRCWDKHPLVAFCMDVMR